MKTKITILVLAVAMVTLSFTLVRAKKEVPTNYSTQQTTTSADHEPAGGFESEQLLK